MGIEFVATKSGGEVPQIEDGTYPAVFKGAERESHPDWATNRDRFGKADDGERIRWNFDVIDSGDVIPLNILTKVNVFNTESKTVPWGVRILKALMTKAEFVLWKDNDPEAPKADDLVDRKVQVEIVTAEGDGEWPKIKGVIAKAKG